MKESIGSVSTKGQITIPQDIRNKLGIQPGDTVAISLQDEKIVVRPTDMSIRAGYRSVPALKKPLSDDEITEIAARVAVADFVRDRSNED